MNSVSENSLTTLTSAPIKTIFGFLMLCTFQAFANAQCPDGQPPDPRRGCNRPSPPKPSNVCSINILITRKDTGKPLPEAAITLETPTIKRGITDGEGSYNFTGLACKRRYKITPSHQEFAFDPPFVRKNNLQTTDSASFSAIPRVVSTPTPSPLPCPSPPKNPPVIKVGESRNGRLSPWCVNRGQKQYFSDHQLKDIIGGDILQITIQASQAPDISLLVFDSLGNPVKTQMTNTSGQPPYYQLEVPEESTYTLRVISNSNRPGEYQLTINRTGLTAEGYDRQLQLAYEALGEPGKPTFYDSLNHNLERFRSGDTIAGQKIQKATVVLERLRELHPERVPAYSMLSAIYLYHRKDLKSATETAIQSLKFGGEARFRVIFGKEIDKKDRRILYNIHYCWLVIRKGEAFCDDFKQEGTRKIFTTESQNLRRIRPDISGVDYGFKIYGRGVKESKDRNKSLEYETRDFDFIPLSSQGGDPNFLNGEVALIKQLIQQYIRSER